MINEINDMLIGIGLSEQDIERWWNSRNKAFDEQKPIDVFQVFPRQVYRYVHAHYTGGW